MRVPFPRRVNALGLVLLCLTVTRAVPAQQPAPSSRDTTLATAITAGEADADPGRRSLFRRRNFDWGFTSFNFGGGILVEHVSYAQDDASKAQVDNLSPELKVRDARVLFGGRFKTKRPITWQMGVMYDGANEAWLVRQTGVMVAVPELWGHVFIGRAKEGVSLNKVMTGYDGWTMERFTFSDAIPLLADGVKWLGYAPNRHFLWNLGWFTDVLSEGQSFSSYDNQFTARAAWVPMVSDSIGTLLHIGMNYRRGKLNEGQIQLRSRPEAFPAPYFIDTGKFPARSAQLAGPEFYYRPGNWLFGGEYYWQMVDSPQMNDPVFHGGDAFVSWVITGETRSYNTVGGYFRSIAPAKTILQRGPGAWEALVRFSYSDLTDGPVQGGTLWRVTPMVNWYFTDVTRLELAYGYGTLDRFETSGVTQFFQARLQIEF
jgi:phosphate-selective porin OprO/OprP